MSFKCFKCSLELKSVEFDDEQKDDVINLIRQCKECVTAITHFNNNTIQPQTHTVLHKFHKSEGRWRQVYTLRNKPQLLDSNNEPSKDSSGKVLPIKTCVKL